MDEQQRAEEHLRVIRNLMERAVIYRAISAPTALVGGLLSVAISCFIDARDANRFILVWLLVLVATLVSNTWFIARKARREGGPIFSAGLKLAIWSAAPALLVTALLTAIIWQRDGAEGASLLMATLWTAFYGLALLSTATFAPRSLVVLGWSFLLTGILACLVEFELWKPVFSHPAVWLMGLSFGGYHLIYAVCTWPRKQTVATAPTPLE